MQSKTDIRKTLLALRRGIASEEKKRSEDLIAGHVRTLPEYRDARVVALYYPVQGEVNLISLMQDNGKTFLFPKVQESDLLFFPARNLDDFAPGRFGIPEPVQGEAFQVEKIDLIFVPALCFDDQGHRLGYGKGYYDRLLQAYPGIATVGVSFDQCRIERLPVDPWDVNVDYIVTQTGVFRSNSVRCEVQ